uniref:Tetratricopeptide repeat-containing protein n=1 Tax=Candidatus Kentrum sp. FM TaxID=2126340 RepID=A0A450T2P3_9GAMM|nr:MAG: hypothetical protein BECKFM1743C_GA0114222_101192 [Candidatus Kentron sp. FM]VFJ60557.1 MAG: hypothetical protein BECKFM1743A_GA0114220_102672 [Candidatus Kentron sp. FM]VFK12976.1 MAG: hypothetical protein BECKFM1743B_GA0114221_102632 [Candidatus Kentron sp. FM]
MKTAWPVLVFILFFAGHAAAEPPSAAGGNGESVFADPIVQQVVRFLRDKNGKEPSAEEIAGLLNSAIVHHLNEGNYAEAKPIARQVLAFGQARLDVEHPDTLMRSLCRHCQLVTYAKSGMSFQRNEALERNHGSSNA